ncbi:MAG: hypothetical protein R3Y51_07560 [Rikenellaceae bacterium]
MENSNVHYVAQISGHSIEWTDYIKYYNISYKQKGDYDYTYMILRENTLKRIENIDLPDNVENLAIKIHIISPDNTFLAPLNVIVNIFKEGKLVDEKKISREWDESSLSIDLNYVF